MRAIAKDAGQRISSADNFLEELGGAVDAISTRTVERFLVDKPLPVESLSAAARGSAMRSIAITAIVVLAAVAGLFFADFGRPAGGAGVVVSSIAFADVRLGDDPVQPGKDFATGKTNLQLHGRIDGIGAAVEETKVRLQCNGRDTGSVEVAADGSFSVDLELDPGENTVTLSFGDRQMTTVVRREPGRVTLDPNGNVVALDPQRLLTKESSITIEGTVEDWMGDTEILLIDGESETKVPVHDARFSTTVELATDGSRDLRWEWGQGARRKPLGRLTVIRDSLEPTLTLSLPEPGFVTAGSELTVRGSMEDAFRRPGHAGGAAVISIDGEEVDRVAWDGAGRIDAQVKLPAGVLDRTVMFTVTVSDHVGNSTEVTLEGRIDRSPPAFEGHPDFEIVDDRAGRAQSLKIRGKATEALAGVEIDGKAATFSGSEFESVALRLESGEQSFSVVLTDLAGNSARLSATNTFDRTPPALTNVRFSDDGSGGTAVEVRCDEQLGNATVLGKKAVVAEDGSSFRYSVPHRYEDLTDEDWGPTHDPIVISLEDRHGNAFEARYLICPIDGTAISLEAGTVPACSQCSGRYCPRLKGYSKHPESRRPGLVKDRWVDRQVNKYCRYCGYPRKPKAPKE